MLVEITENWGNFVLRTTTILVRMLSALLALAVLLGLGIPAAAEEVETAGTVPPAETVAATSPVETTLPPETTIATEPPETTAPPETTQTTAPPETTAPAETTRPVEEIPETTAPEVTVPVTQPTEETEEPPALLTAARAAVTVERAAAMTEGTARVQGTVVYLGGTQLVLEDSTGGLLLSADSLEGLGLGDVLLADILCGSSPKLEAYHYLNAGELPARKTTLRSAPERVRVQVENAVLFFGSLKEGDYSLSYVGTFPQGLENGDAVTAFGVILDGCFYADTILPYEGEAPVSGEWNHYFGLLHAHSNLSDGIGEVEEAFAYASQVPGLDFFAVTDHSDSFDHALEGSITGGVSSDDWSRGREAAEAVTGETFVGLYGYEMTWQEDKALGHLCTFGTPGWQTRDQKGFEQSLTAYYDALTLVPGSISQFNHPGLAYGDFEQFDHYTPRYDAVIHLLELNATEDIWETDHYYRQALDKGWHVAPSNNQNNHRGNWGDATGGRTVVLAKTLAEESIFDAIRNHRVYATEDPDLRIEYRVNGQIMGSILNAPETLTASVKIVDPTDGNAARVEVVSDAPGESLSVDVQDGATFSLPAGGSYYYLRILQADGNQAVTAPVWVDAYSDMGIRSFTADTSQPGQGETVNLRLEVYNDENVALTLENIRIWDQKSWEYTLTEPGSVEQLGESVFVLSYPCTEAGEALLTAEVTGSCAGSPRRYTQTLELKIQPKAVTTCAISQARLGTGGAYRISGYVTAGNSVPHNSFPDTIYLQDDSGGIAVTGCNAQGLQVGTPMEIEGILQNSGGNPVLVCTEYEILDIPYYRYVPRTMTHDVAMDYAAHGGELLQIEGEVVSLVKTEDAKGISRLTLKDIRGDLATVVIEEHIGSLAYGTNELAKDIRSGRTVRAMGLLHMDEYGTAVLRVRNCEEVVYVPPVADTSNPKTGDR